MDHLRFKNYNFIMAKNKGNRKGNKNDDSSLSDSGLLSNTPNKVEAGPPQTQREQKPRSYHSNEYTNQDGTSTVRLETQNLSLSSIATEGFNSSILTSSYLSAYESDFCLTLTVLPRKFRLIELGLSWADKIIGLPHVDMRKVLNGSSPQYWRAELCQLYIFSYFQMLCSVLWSNERIKTGQTLYNCLGHAIMASALTQSMYTYSYNDFTVSYNLEMTSDDRDNIVEVLESFEWLKPLLKERLKNRFVSCPIRSKQLGTLSTMLRLGDDPTIIKSEPGTYESLEFYNSNTSLDQFAFANSFYDSKDKSAFWYISGQDRITERFLLFGKCLFFTLKRESENFPRSNTYAKMTTKDSGRLVRFELQTIDKCRFPDLTSSDILYSLGTTNIERKPKLGDIFSENDSINDNDEGGNSTSIPSS
jgi:hypothetical protein